MAARSGHFNTVQPVSKSTWNTAVEGATLQENPFHACRRCIGLLAKADVINRIPVDPEDEDDIDVVPWPSPVCLLTIHSSAVDGCRMCEVMFKKILSRYAKKVLREDAALATKLLNARNHACVDAQRCAHRKTIQVLEMKCWSATDVDIPSVRINVDLYFKNGYPHHERPDVEHPDEKLVWMLLGFDAYPSSQHDISAPYLKYSAPNMNASGTAARDTARAWFEKCKSECTLCGPPPKRPDEGGEFTGRSGKLPSRLVDLSLATGDNDLALISDIQDITAQYATLSYCWGAPHQPQATTTHNLNKRRKGFSSKDLPQTFRDAIRVTSSLGIKYLWIDALCIIQDSADDKKHEIERIKEVFEQSSLTVVAASAAANTDGFLIDHNLSREYDVPRMPFWTPNGRIGSINLLHRTDTIDLLSDAIDPVQKRAWTLEEFILSPRRLCYTSEQLVWSCRGFQSTDGGHNFPGDRQQKALQRLDIRFTSGNVDIGAFWNTWTEVIEHYTTRQLTHSRDRLVAIEGIARRMANDLGWHYHLGVWIEQLLHSLCWQRRNRHHMMSLETAEAYRRGNVSTRISSHYCPSWSWGYITGAVSLPLSRSLRPYTDDVFACTAVDSHKISLRGWLLPVTYCTCNSERASSPHLRLQLEGDECYQPDIIWDAFDQVSSSNLPSYQTDQDHANSPGQRGELFYLPLKRSTDPAGSIADGAAIKTSWDTQSLIVERAPTTPCRYRRRGFVARVATTSTSLTYDRQGQAKQLIVLE